GCWYGKLGSYSDFHGFSFGFLFQIDPPPTCFRQRSEHDLLRQSRVCFRSLPGPLALAIPPRQFIRQPIMKILSPEPPTVPHRFIFSVLYARHLHSPLKFAPVTSRIFLQTMLSQQPI